MSENTNTNNDTTSSVAAEDTKEFTPITSQDQLNAVVGDRLARERKKYADYEDLKAKAAKLDELEEANKSELEKAQAQIAQLQKTNQAYELAQLRTQVAASKELPVDAAGFLTGTTQEELEATADQLAKLLQSSQPAASGPTVSSVLKKANGGVDAGTDTASQFAAFATQQGF